MKATTASVCVMLMLCCSEATSEFGNLRQHAYRERRADDLAASSIVVQQLSQELTEVKAKLAALEAREAKREVQAAFLAYPSKDPFNVIANNKIAFDAIITNVGNAYDKDSGIFTAPAAGVYAFHVNCMDRYDANHDFAMRIIANGVHVAECYSMSESISASGSANAIVHLQAGQRVWVLSDRTEDARGSLNTTFGGYLVTADV